MARGRKAPTKYVLPKDARWETLSTEYLIYGNQARAKGHSLSNIAAHNKRNAQQGGTRGVNAADVSMNNPPHWK